jgi:hypothetical protein
LYRQIIWLPPINHFKNYCVNFNKYCNNVPLPIMKKFTLYLSLTFLTANSFAQNSLLDSLEAATATSEKVTGTFESQRVINAHTTEMVGRGNLDFRILHRFGTVENGLKDLFGLDYASMRMSFDYGITDNVMVGIGRSTRGKEVDGLIKVRVLQQQIGKKNIPISLAIAQGWVINGAEYFGVGANPNLEARSSYYTQVIIARKFSNKFSLQVSPIFVRNNRTENFTDDKSIFAPGAGMRIRLNRKFSLTADYHHFIGTLGTDKTNPLSVGVDIETGGHVFQLHFSNSAGTNEKQYITGTTGNFLKGDFRFGFNLSRMFAVGKKAKNW